PCVWIPRPASGEICARYVPVKKLSSLCRSRGLPNDYTGNIPQAAGKQHDQGGYMSKVRVLAGTRKGAFIVTSDGKRQQWRIDGPFFGGWEIYHLAGSPADPDRLYASQSSSWFGQIIQRSNDGGLTWEQPGK